MLNISIVLKNYTFPLGVFLTAVIFNLDVFRADIGERLNSMNFWLLSVVTACAFYGYSLWITVQYFQIDKLKTARGKQVNLVSLPVIGRYFLLSIIPIMLFHTIVIWCFAALSDNAGAIFMHYIYTHFPMMLALLVGYAAVLLWRPACAAPYRFTHREVREVVPPSSLDQSLDLYSLFFYLFKSRGMGPVMQEMTVRFFDIVLIETYTKAHYLVLSNGEKLQCTDIMKELKKHGLDKWLLRISRNVYINMMLVDYPITNMKKLMLQREVYVHMQQNMLPGDIDKKLELGGGVTDKRVKDFLKHKNSMDHKGWDTFIPLH